MRNDSLVSALTNSWWVHSCTLYSILQREPDLGCCRATESTAGGTMGHLTRCKGAAFPVDAAAKSMRSVIFAEQGRKEKKKERRYLDGPEDKILLIIVAAHPST